MSETESPTPSTPHFAVGKEMLAQITQTMLDLKKMGRSIENGADSLRPLTDDQTVTDLLRTMATYGKEAALIADRIYHSIAREALRG